MKKQKLFQKGTIVGVSYPSIKKSVEVDAAKLSAEMREYAMFHGLGQRLGDAKSGGTAQEKFEYATRIVAQMYTGQWDLDRTRDDTGILFEAVARVLGIEAEEVEETFDEKSEEKQEESLASWRGNMKVRKAIADIRAERAAEAAADSENPEL